MTDTPPTTAFPPPSGLEQAKAFIGDLARPFAIYAMASSTAAAVIMRVDTGLLTAAGVILATLYGAKAVESAVQANATARVAVAQAQAPAAAQP